MAHKTETITFICIPICVTSKSEERSATKFEAAETKAIGPVQSHRNTFAYTSHRLNLKSFF